MIGGRQEAQKAGCGLYGQCDIEYVVGDQQPRRGDEHAYVPVDHEGITSGSGTGDLEREVYPGHALDA